MSTPIEKVEYRGHTISIYQDTDPESPRESYNLGTITYKRGARIMLGDKAVDADELQTLLADETLFVLPVYAYVHGSVSLSLGPFGCPWDSGQSGVIYCDKAKAAKAFPGTPESELAEKVKLCFEHEIKTYDAYLNGSVEDYVTDTDDACWGYYSREQLLEDAKAAIDIVADREQELVRRTETGTLDLTVLVREHFAKKAQQVIDDGALAQVAFLRKNYPDFELL